MVCFKTTLLKKLPSSWQAFAFMTLVIGACSSAPSTTSTPQSPLPGVAVGSTLPNPVVLPTPDVRSQFVASKDGKDQIALPEGWTVETGLNPEAQIQVSHRGRGMFLIVLSEPKAAFQNMTGEKHSEAARKLLTENLAESEMTGPTEVKQIHGNPAIQYKIQGALNNISVKFLHTTVETPTQFVQILAWTRPDAFAANQSALQKVVQSFREQATASPSPIPSPAASPSSAQP